MKKIINGLWNVNNGALKGSPESGNVINLRKFQKNVDKFIKKCGEAFLNEYISGG